MKLIRMIARLAVAPVVALVLLAAAVAAGASVSPTITATQTVAGIYAAPNAARQADGDHITGERATFTLTPAMEYGNEGTPPKIGLSGCQFVSLNVSSEDVVVVYAQWNKATGVFDIYAGDSSSSDCLNGLNTVPATLIDTIPAGHDVFLAWTQDSHLQVFATDEDLTADTGGSTVSTHFHAWLNRAGAGALADTALLTTPADNLLVSFGSLQVRDTTGKPHGWADYNRTNLTRLVDVRVEATTDGTTSGAVLVNPVITGQAGLNLLDGQLSS